MSKMKVEVNLKQTSDYEEENITSLITKVDKDLKKEFSVICKKLGTTQCGALKLFVTAVVREQRIPFELKL